MGETGGGITSTNMAKEREGEKDGNKEMKQKKEVELEKSTVAVPQKSKKKTEQKSDQREQKEEQKQTELSSPAVSGAKEGASATKIPDEKKASTNEKGASKSQKETTEKKGEEKKSEVVSETIYTISLAAAYRTKPCYKRTNKAIKFLLSFLKRHTKSENVHISPSLNSYIWKRGARRPPRRLQIKAVKDAEGRVTAELL